MQNAIRILNTQNEFYRVTGGRIEIFKLVYYSQRQEQKQAQKIIVNRNATMLVNYTKFQLEKVELHKKALRVHKVPTINWIKQL